MILSGSAPFVGRFGILPEVLFGCFLPLRCEVFADHVERRRVRRYTSAYRPVAAINQPVLAESLPQFVESGAVEAHFLGNTIARTARDIGHLGIYLRPLAKFAQGGVIG